MTKYNILFFFFLITSCGIIYGQSTVPVPEGVTVIRNLPYVPNGTGEQTLDLYLPKNFDPLKSYPVILSVHGGGWMMGSNAFDYHYMGSHVMSQLLTTEEYIVASVNYRHTTDWANGHPEVLVSENAFPAAIQDVKTSVRYLRYLAENDPNYTYLNTDKIGAWGGSAGGNLVSLLGTSGGVAAFETSDYAGYSSAIQSVVEYCGKQDITLVLDENHRYIPQWTPTPNYIAYYIGADGEPSTFDKAVAASPITYVDASDPSMLLIHGTADETNSYEHSSVMKNALTAQGVAVNRLSLYGTGHDGPAFVSSTTLNMLTAHFHQTLLDLPTLEMIDGDYDGIITDAALWQGGITPVPGQKTVMNGGNKTLHQTEDGFSFYRNDLTVNGGNILSDWGTYIDSFSTVSFLNGSTLDSPLAILVGLHGDGKLIVGDGSQITVNDYGLHLGANTARGEMVLQGTANANTYVRVGSQDANIAGEGFLTVDGGHLIITNPSVDVPSALSVGFASESVGNVRLKNGSISITNGKEIAMENPAKEPWKSRVVRFPARRLFISVKIRVPQELYGWMAVI